jgi:hypothetical protein
MADIAGPITTRHPVEACYGSMHHCYSHEVDEPFTGVRWCFECRHMFATAEELLAGHNRQLAGFGMPPETDVGQVHDCPWCLHAF